MTHRAFNTADFFIRPTNGLNSPPTGDPASNPGLTPSAPTLGLLQARNSYAREKYKIQTWLDKNNEYPRYIKACIALMYEHGLRISELLAIREYDLSPLELIRIRSKKGSAQRIIKPTLYSQEWFRDTAYMPSLLKQLNRWYFHRLCIRYGFYFYMDNGKNRSTTHYFRHLYFLGLEISQWDKETIKNAAGHRSIKSQDYYVGKENIRRKV